MNISDIRERAQGVVEGDVTPAEVDYAREVLRAREGDIGSALYIVGLCGFEGDAPLIESYLYGKQKDVYGELALKALCRYLGLIDRYRKTVRKYLMADTDVDFYGSRMAAIHLAKEYLRNFHDAEVERRLVAIFCDLEDEDRRSARDELVDILGLRKMLKDPFGLNDTRWDEGATLILEEACRVFRIADLDFVRSDVRH